MANIENLINSVANKLGRHETEKNEIRNFLNGSKHWCEHLKEFGIEATASDLNFVYGFGGMNMTEEEQKEFNQFYIQLTCGGKNG